MKKSRLDEVIARIVARRVPMTADEIRTKLRAEHGLSKVTARVLDNLTDREKRVLALRFGYADRQAAKDCPRLAAGLECHEHDHSRIAEIEAKALAKLRGPFREKPEIE